MCEGVAVLVLVVAAVVAVVCDWCVTGGSGGGGAGAYMIASDLRASSCAMSSSDLRQDHRSVLLAW